MALTAGDREWIVQRALGAGFDLAGVAGVPEPGSAEAREESERFERWVEAGHAGDMDYLKRADDAGEYLRGDIRRSLPWARSVIVCAVNYSTPEAPLSTDPAEAGSGWIGRYAWSGKGSGKKGGKKSGARGTDEPVIAADYYHDILLPQLRALEAELVERFGPECETRCYVDTGPVLERGYAVAAGIGWIGRNTCVINQQKGSWLLLGVVVTSLGVAAEATMLPAADRCGSCTRCIDACPTDALLLPATPDAPRQMDASRCIAYLTIEKKGSIAEELRAPMGRQIFGCDICQDVCPWNARASRGPVAVAASSVLSPRSELINPSLAWLASLDSAAFTRLFRGSPVERRRRDHSRRKRFYRNLAIAMGNSGDRSFMPQLAVWAAGTPAGGERPDPALAEAAAWAIARLQRVPEPVPER